MKSVKGSKEKTNHKRKNVNVVVRTRPMNEDERQARCRNIVNCDSVAKTLTLKSSDSQNKQQQKTFGPFDRVYGPESTQIDVYADVVAPLVKEVLNGYNCTVFAYGQTGSGKTYTMEGRHDESGDFSWDNDPTSGIIPRALHHIFTALGDQELDYYSVRASYVEMYNEQIYDLLSVSETQESLRIFDDKNKGVAIVGMEEIAVRNRNEVYALLRRGAEKRRTASTLMNINSSRSHSVFTVTVMMREPGCADGEELIRQGKINLVDLAGSENIGRSGATDKRAREAGNINVSLLALGRVISALTTNAQHIPYRESKLTRILQDSLGGKTITTIIATLSPSSSNFEESINTLDYAQRAKNIKNNPEVNQKITRKALLKEYNDEIERLRRDLVAAREKTGIYLDKENYDTMVEQNEENRVRIEELEGQLEAQLHQMKILVEDMEMMDEHYRDVYQKCQLALSKLESRKIEVESLNKDLSRAKSSLKSANNALSQSSNAFTQLRAQAFSLQENCSIYHSDLDVMHDRLETLKSTFQENDRLLGHFAAERIAAVNRAKNDLHYYVDASDKQTSTVHGKIVHLQQLAEHFMRTLNENLNNISESVDSQRVLAHHLSQSLTENLSESQSAMERFIHQEFKRVTSTGFTPTRREANYVKQIVDLPPPAELLQQQEQLATPRRSSFYKARDSLLDSDFRRMLLSPNALKTVIANKHLDTVDEMNTSGSEKADDNERHAMSELN